MNNGVFATGVKANNGNPTSPAFSFITNNSTGFYLDSDGSICVTNNGSIVAKFGQTIELLNNLRISQNVSNRAVLSSNENGTASWEVRNLYGEFKWNSLYKWLDIDSANNSIDIVFDDECSRRPSISLTKESDSVISNFDLFIKDKTKHGFKIFSNSFMSKKVLIGNTGEYATCSLVNGGVGIVYYNFDLDRMEYIYSDADYIFSQPVVIDENSAIGICDIAIVDESPAVIYMADDGSNDKWRYARASNQDGSAWGEPVILLTSTEDMTFMSNSLFLRMVNNKPCVFVNNEVGRAMVIISTDIHGDVWNTPISISNLVNHQILDVKIVEGAPAVIAKSTITSEMFYVRSQNDRGDAWPLGAIKLYKSGHNPILVNVGKSCNSLAIINDTVCIITTEASTNSLYISQALDIYGNTWSSYELLTTTNTSNVYPRVFVNNGTSYLMYNSYSGNPSEKSLLEFKADNTVEKSCLISSLLNCMDHQILPCDKDGHNTVILDTNQTLVLLKFYGNDFVINWSATV